MISLRDINPTRRVPLITLVLIAVNVLVFLYEQTMSLGDYAYGGVAFFAHIGGFIAGAILIRIFTVGRNPDDWWRPPPDPWA
jgi:membrane associated rhomboid family serine protease